VGVGCGGGVGEMGGRWEGSLCVSECERMQFLRVGVPVFVSESECAGTQIGGREKNTFLGGGWRGRVCFTSHHGIYPFPFI